MDNVVPKLMIIQYRQIVCPMNTAHQKQVTLTTVVIANIDES